MLATVAPKAFHDTACQRPGGYDDGGRDMIEITPTLAIDEREIDERFVRASGPGGQHVNKVASAVQLRFHIGRSSLPAEVQRRLAALAGRRMTDEGVLQIESREYRTQAQNRGAARDRLVALVRQALVAPKRRKPTRPKLAAKERRLQVKKLRAGVKAGRGRAGGDD
jgi:ribosome-associated protein